MNQSTMEQQQVFLRKRSSQQYSIPLSLSSASSISSSSSSSSSTELFLSSSIVASASAADTRRETLSASTFLTTTTAHQAARRNLQSLGGGGNGAGGGTTSGGSVFVESILFFGFMFALSFLVWTLIQYGCRRACRREREARLAEEEMRLRARVLSARHGGGGGARPEYVSSHAIIVMSSSGLSAQHHMTPTQSADRRTFLEDVLINIPFDPSKIAPSQLKFFGACAICLEEYTVGDSITHSYNKHCRHVFHRSCAIQWFSSLSGNDDTCPVCRQNFLRFADDNVENSNSQIPALTTTSTPSLPTIMTMPHRQYASSSSSSSPPPLMHTDPSVLEMIRQRILSAHPAQHHHLPASHPQQLPSSSSPSRRVDDAAGLYLQTEQDATGTSVTESMTRAAAASSSPTHSCIPRMLRDANDGGTEVDLYYNNGSADSGTAAVGGSSSNDPGGSDDDASVVTEQANEELPADGRLFSDDNNNNNNNNNASPAAARRQPQERFHQEG